MNKLKKLAASLSTRSVRVGGYSVVAICIVLAIIIAANILVSALPAAVTQIDMTPNKLYSISQQTQKLLKSLDQDVTLYWVVQPGQEDIVLENLLAHYDTGSSHIRLEKIDPDVSPTFIKTYVTEELNNNAVVVESQLRFRYVNIDDIYLEERDPNTFDLVYNFAGEDALTSAIDYVTRAELPKIALVTDHGSATLDDSYTRAMSLENFETVKLSLASSPIGQDVDLLLIPSPTEDISAEEAAKIKAFLNNGGDMLLLSTVSQDGFPNLYSCLADHGISQVSGVVMEGDAKNTMYNNPTYISANLLSHDITQPLIDSKATILLPEAHGLQISDTLPEGVTATPLLRTSSEAYSKTGAWPLTTDEKESGDIDGPFTLAVAITRQGTDGNNSNIVCISSAQVLNPSLYCDNLDFFMNCLNWISGNERSISIRPKVQDTSMLTINSDSGNTMKVLMIGVLPLSLLAVGIVVYNRRKKQ